MKVALKKQIVWLGYVSHYGSVRGKSFPIQDEPMHDEEFQILSGGSDHHRWRYLEGTNTVFWWILPNKDDQEAVGNYLFRKGFKDLQHRDMDTIVGKYKDSDLTIFVRGEDITHSEYKRKDIFQEYRRQIA